MACHVVRARDTVFVFKSAYEPGAEITKVQSFFHPNTWSIVDSRPFTCRQVMGAHLVAHGDGVKDVSFTVEDLEGIIIQCKKKGVTISLIYHHVYC